jgi:hypothetical protein
MATPAQIARPSLCLLLLDRDFEADRPVSSLEAMIFNLSHAADTIRDHNLCSGLSSHHFGHIIHRAYRPGPVALSAAAVNEGDGG